MTTIRFGSGEGATTVSHDLQGLVRRSLRELTKGASDRLEQEAASLFREARDVWPVKTGKSIRELDHGLRVVRNAKGDSVAGFVGSGTKTIFLVKFKDRRKHNAQMASIRIMEESARHGGTPNYGALVARHGGSIQGWVGLWRMRRGVIERDAKGFRHPATLDGKHVWTWAVRRPHKRRLGPLMIDLRKIASVRLRDVAKGKV